MFLRAVAGQARASAIESTENFSWSVSGGVEIAIGEKFALRPVITCASIVVEDSSSDEDDNGLVGLDFNYWPIKRLFLNASSTLNVESKDIDLLLGVGVRF